LSYRRAVPQRSWAWRCPCRFFCDKSPPGGLGQFRLHDAAHGYFGPFATAPAAVKIDPAFRAFDIGKEAYDPAWAVALRASWNGRVWRHGGDGCREPDWHWRSHLFQSYQKKDGGEQGQRHPEHKDQNGNQSVHWWFPADDVGALTSQRGSRRCEWRRTRGLARS